MMMMMMCMFVSLCLGLMVFLDLFVNKEGVLVY